MKNVQTISNAKPQTPTCKKKDVVVEKKEVKTLREKIEEQKKRLRREMQPGVCEKKVASRPKPTVTTRSSRYNYHKGTPKERPNVQPSFNSPFSPPEPEAKSETKTEENSNEPERGELMRENKNSPYSIRSLASKKQQTSAKPEEPRFDTNNYTKSAAAFNIGTNLSKSQLKPIEGLNEESFTERLLHNNNLKNMTKKISARAMSSEDRLLAQCTFQPKFQRRPKVYANVQPRLLSHLEGNIEGRLSTGAELHQSFCPSVRMGADRPDMSVVFQRAQVSKCMIIKCKCYYSGTFSINR